MMKKSIFKIETPPYNSSMMELRDGKRYPLVMKKQEHLVDFASSTEHLRRFSSIPIRTALRLISWDSIASSNLCFLCDLAYKDARSPYLTWC